MCISSYSPHMLPLGLYTLLYLVSVLNQLSPFTYTDMHKHLEFLFTRLKWKQN